MMCVVAAMASATKSVTVAGGTMHIPCSVPCFWPQNPDSSVVKHYTIDNTNITLVMSMESEDYYPELNLNRRSPTKWIASTRFQSDIPMPYFSWAEYNIQAHPLPFEDVKKSALFVARNCKSRSKREIIVAKLQRFMPLTSASDCLRNVAWDGTDKHALMQSHGLYLAFENSIVPDYVTEKLWGAYSAGTIPVYYGAPNIRDHVPANSAVIVTDFESIKALSVHLIAILTNKTLFASYHAWRYRPLPKFFVEKYCFTHTHSACRLCNKVAPLMQ